MPCAFLGNKKGSAEAEPFHTELLVRGFTSSERTARG